MRILVNIGHPGHVHLFKNMIKNLENKGHETITVARDKEMTLRLLDIYGFNYEVISGYYTNMAGKMYDFIKTDLRLLKLAIKTRPDILIAVGDPYVAHVGKLIGKPSVVFTDTENAKLANKLTFPFASVICTPSCYNEDLGEKQIRYNGYHELAYLHPNYFRTDQSVLDDLELSKNDRFIVFRLVSWKASHDIGDKGFKEPGEAIKSLERYGKVLVTSEVKLPSKLEKYKINTTPEKIHSLLYFSSLYIGESATMASESAVLGTPSIFVSSSRRGYTDELESKYGLVYNYSDTKKIQQYALEKAFNLLENENTKREWKRKRNKMLAEKIDVTKFMTDFVEDFLKNYKYC